MQAQGERCSDASVPASVLSGLPSKRAPGPPSSRYSQVAAGLVEGGYGTSAPCCLRHAHPCCACCRGAVAVREQRHYWRSAGAQALGGRICVSAYAEIRSPGSRGGLSQCSPASLEGEGPDPAPCRGSLAGAAPVGVATTRARQQESRAVCGSDPAAPGPPRRRRCPIEASAKLALTARLHPQAWGMGAG